MFKTVTRGINLIYKDEHRREITQLLKAINEKEISETVRLIDLGAESNQQTREFGLPICLALRKNLPFDVIRKITMCGADLNLQGYDGYFPLSLAVNYNREDVVTLFLEHGANPDSVPDSCRITAYTAIHTAVAKRNIPMLRILHCYGANLDINDTCLGMTPLVWAIRAGYKDIVEILLSLGAKINGKDRNRHTALYYANKHENKDMAGLLVHKGAFATVQPDEQKNSQLIWAVENGRTGIAKKLLYSGISPNIERYPGLPLLFVAVQNFNLEITTLLLNSGAEVNRKDNLESCSPLEKFLNILNRKSKNSNIDISHIIKIVHLFLEKGAITEESSLRSSVLNEAVHSSSEILHEVLNYTQNINFRTRSGTTALMEAAATGNFENAELLIKFKADINAKCYSNGMTALMYAASAGNYEITCLLVDQGADIKLCDFSGCTVFFHAVYGPVSLNQPAHSQLIKSNRIKIFRLLLAKFVKSNINNSRIEKLFSGDETGNEYLSGSHARYQSEKMELQHSNQYMIPALDKNLLKTTIPDTAGILNFRLKETECLTINVLFYNENVEFIKSLLINLMNEQHDNCKYNKKAFSIINNYMEMLYFMKIIFQDADIFEDESNTIVEISLNNEREEKTKLFLQNNFVIVPVAYYKTIVFCLANQRNKIILDIMRSFTLIKSERCLGLKGRNREVVSGIRNEGKNIGLHSLYERAAALEKWIRIHSN